MSNQCVIRISKVSSCYNTSYILMEISDIQRDSDLSIAVACKDADVRNVTALIIGPHETPYEFGFFEFGFKFPKEYPRAEPQVTALTTNSGRTRFNPNIYADGKVCLSILGTWRGERGEQWSAAQGLESILLSIQSLMSSNPYENEPGFEDANEPIDEENRKKYVEKIRHETLRISVIVRLERYLNIAHVYQSSRPSVSQSLALAAETCPGYAEDDTPFEPFKDLCKRRFLWYYDAYMDSVSQGEAENCDKTHFTRMPFEGHSNIMNGSFNYADLKSRLKVIKSKLDKETLAWAVAGKQKFLDGSTVAANLQGQFEHVVEMFKANSMPHNIELEDGSPFVWVVTYFGKPMTNLDGGMFRFRISISPSFPHEQPRVRVETKIFHHRVAKDGTACYFVTPQKREDIMSHITGVIDALEEENPSYDPRTMVHPEAHNLLWGSADDRKMYNRRLRRSVQQSME
ncbi:ubiquitin-conjugating enzyme [Ophiostoma piceae UAMH 11346]|uniref:Ubiquitin-conjugating enzyme E2 Z n=1 Tax=Ophiostoma piceae (strain UAMH 11346) TaxID=1262450 RepID=S3BY24_OPHP1|nr:ubiquitin-conjugating enzyme [Ophiostoma piceae UAMH 11346]